MENNISLSNTRI